MISRGLETLLKKHIRGFECWSLREAASNLRQGVSALRGPPADDSVCWRCQAPKKDMESIVADAGQFFESVSASDASKALGHLRAETEKADAHPSISVYRCPKRRVFAGGRLRNPRNDLKTFTVDELSGCVLGFCACNLAQVTWFVAEFAGLPIGGFLSKVIKNMFMHKIIN